MASKRDATPKRTRYELRGTRCNYSLPDTPSDPERIIKIQFKDDEELCSFEGNDEWHEAVTRPQQRPAALKQLDDIVTLLAAHTSAIDATRIFTRLLKQLVLTMALRHFKNGESFDEHLIMMVLSELERKIELHECAIPLLIERRYLEKTKETRKMEKQLEKEFEDIIKQNSRLDDSKPRQPELKRKASVGVQNQAKRRKRTLPGGGSDTSMYD